MGLLGFPGVGWLFAGFPVAALVLLIVGPGAGVGGDPARVLAVRAGSAAPPRLEGGVRVAAAERAALGGDAPPRAPAPAAPGSRAREGRSGADTRRGGLARAASLAGVGVIGLVLVALPLVPAVSGLGHHAAAATPTRQRFTQGDHRPVPQHAAREGQAVRLARPAEPVPGGRAARARARRPRPPHPRRRPWTGPAPTSCSTSIDARGVAARRCCAGRPPSLALAPARRLRPAAT